MNILYVCHRFPFPPRRGGKIRPFNMIRHLSKSGHEVTVASLARSSAEAEEARGIAAYCRHYEVVQVHKALQAVRMLLRLPTLTPSSMGYFYSPLLAAKVRRLCATERFDLIFVHCSSVAQYVAGVSGIPKILDFGDMDSQKWLEYGGYKPFPLSAGYWLEGRKLEREERRLTQYFDMCTATTRAEWETLERYETGVGTDWFPNGVDSAYFSPADTPYDRNQICFVGRMDYYPNQECMFDFCANVLPLLQQRRHNIRLMIVGADPSAAVRKLGERRGVSVTGAVPDVRPYVRGSALMVAPLNIARGTQNKILEAMALGVPVVASQVAARGVDVIPGEHLLIASTPEEYAAAVLRILDDGAERARLSAAGRSRMLSHHDWSSSMRRLDHVIDRCLATYTSHPARRERTVAHNGAPAASDS